MRVLLLDAYNLMHRARFGFGKGDHNIVFNFFRGLRPIMEEFAPQKAYFVLEGVPKGNIELLPEYKANRQRSPDDFHRQRKIIEQLMSDCMPIVSARHDDFECDDVLYSIVKNWHPDDEVVVVSSDSDFIQMYDEFENVTIWHPVKKKVVPAPDYNYVEWKALRGDQTDNIPGIKGVGDKTAEKLVRDPTLLAERLKNPEFAAQRERNLKLISLEDLGDRMEEVSVWGGSSDWESLGDHFDAFEFRTMRKEKTWTKYVKTFENLESNDV